jgi:hypothetical protein
LVRVSSLESFIKPISFQAVTTSQNPPNRIVPRTRFSQSLRP